MGAWLFHVLNTWLEKYHTHNWNNLNLSKREERRWHHRWSTTPKLSEGITHFWTCFSSLMFWVWVSHPREISSNFTLYQQIYLYRCSCPWAGWSPCVTAGQALAAWGAALQKRTWGPAGQRAGMSRTSIPGCTDRSRAAGQGKWLSPLAQHLLDCV